MRYVERLLLRAGLCAAAVHHPALDTSRHGLAENHAPPNPGPEPKKESIVGDIVRGMGNGIRASKGQSTPLGIITTERLPQAESVRSAVALVGAVLLLELNGVEMTEPFLDVPGVVKAVDLLESARLASAQVVKGCSRACTRMSIQRFFATALSQESPTEPKNA
ncbi:hypothetical protein P1P68_14635 [Streptomyces scabiei]|uniref:hypothetical protein n=1 Tax=Streptomyces scabiei TaxID=1930 RepID=UPI0029903198|nr:hypothetical protein [Streptomyces scabiei]MDW8805985.1 hypothetical protein [Streptomyces scabiei]